MSSANGLPMDSATMMVEFYGGPHDGDAFQLDAEKQPTDAVARSHRTGAGPVRTVYVLSWCPCHHWRYIFALDSEQRIEQQ